MFKQSSFYVKIFLLFCILNQVFGQEKWFGDFAKFNSWKVEKSYQEENRQIVNDPLGGSDKVLKVKYQKDSYAYGKEKGGTGFFVLPFKNDSVEHVTFEYDVLFPTGFGFGKGGKIPGVFGGRFDCSGGDKALDCFSARFMFGSGGDGFQYLYVSKEAKHTKEFCDLLVDQDCAPKTGYHLGRTKFFTPGKWTHIKQEIKLNTLKKANGVLRFWVDGVKKFDFDKIIYRTEKLSISGIKFETFFGGRTQDWASPKEQYSYFKNLKLQSF